MSEPIRPQPAQDSDSAFSFGSARISGVGHLTTQAVAAYVDGELRMGAHMRASAHLGSCAQCAEAVEVQRSTRSDLRRCGKPTVPETLLGSLRSIPHLAAPQDGHDGASAADFVGPEVHGRGKPRWRWPF